MEIRANSETYLNKAQNSCRLCHYIIEPRTGRFWKCFCCVKCIQAVWLWPPMYVVRINGCGKPTRIPSWKLVVLTTGYPNPNLPAAQESHCEKCAKKNRAIISTVPPFFMHYSILKTFVLRWTPLVCYSVISANPQDTIRLFYVPLWFSYTPWLLQLEDPDSVHNNRYKIAYCYRISSCRTWYAALQIPLA